MNRRALLLAAAATVIAIPAWADMPVIDMTSIYKMVQQIQWMRDQYQVATQQLQSLTNSLNLSNLAPQLNGAGLQNPFGGMAGQLNGIVSGTSFGGIPGAQQMLQQDQLFNPAGNDLAANAMNGAATMLANLKAAMMNLIGANQQRIGSLNDLQSELQGAPDVATVERVNGRIAVENQTMQMQLAQTQQMVALAQLQQQTTTQQGVQKSRADEEQLINDLEAGGGANANTGIIASTGTTAPAFQASGN